jgi:uncharacterized membrane protein YdjX (TVP38/TMEM64 family)
MIKNLRIKEALAVLVTIAVFITINYYSNFYADELIALFAGRGIEVVFLYILVIIISFIIPPINSVFLFPVMVVLYGSVIAVVASVIAWTGGGILTYYISRKYGKRIVTKFISEEKIEKFSGYEKRLSSKNKFLGLVGLHALLPGDILGYVLGLFITVPYFTYGLTLFIGNIPFTLTALLAVNVSLFWQSMISVVIVLGTLFGVKLFGDKFLTQ